MSGHGFLFWASVVFASIVAMLVIAWVAWYMYGRIYEEKSPADKTPKPDDKPEPKPAPAPATPAPAADKAKNAGKKKNWGCAVWAAIALLLLIGLLWLFGAFNTYQVKTVRTTSSFTQDLKGAIASVHTGVREFYRSNTPLIANTFGNVDIDSPDQYDDSSIDECQPASMVDQECVTDKRRLVRRAADLKGTLSFCWRWDPIDQDAQFHLFGKQVLGPREEIISLISKKSFDHLDIEPTGKIKFSYRMCEASNN